MNSKEIKKILESRQKRAKCLLINFRHMRSFIRETPVSEMFVHEKADEVYDFLEETIDELNILIQKISKEMENENRE